MIVQAMGTHASLRGPLGRASIRQRRRISCASPAESVALCRHGIWTSKTKSNARAVCARISNDSVSPPATSSGTPAQQVPWWVAWQDEIDAPNMNPLLSSHPPATRAVVHARPSSGSPGASRTSVFDLGLLNSTVSHAASSQKLGAHRSWTSKPSPRSAATASGDSCTCAGSGAAGAGRAGGGGSAVAVGATATEAGVQPTDSTTRARSGRARTAPS